MWVRSTVMDCLASARLSGLEGRQFATVWKVDAHETPQLLDRLVCCLLVLTGPGGTEATAQAVLAVPITTQHTYIHTATESNVQPKRDVMLRQMTQTR